MPIHSEDSKEVFLRVKNALIDNTLKTIINKEIPAQTIRAILCEKTGDTNLYHLGYAQK
jgi:hypothetical protein